MVPDLRYRKPVTIVTLIKRSGQRPYRPTLRERAMRVVWVTAVHGTITVPGPVPIATRQSSACRWLMELGIVVCATEAPIEILSPVGARKSNSPQSSQDKATKTFPYYPPLA